MLSLGDVNAGSTVRIPFNTSAVAGESITIGTNGTIAIYKDGSTTERSSANGVTFSEDHDGHTGTHFISIDLSDNSDAGFYAAGSTYCVKYHTATIDGKAVSAWIAQFSIDKTYQYSDARKLAGVTQSLSDLKDFADDGYDPSTNKVQGVALVDSLTALANNAITSNSIQDGAISSGKFTVSAISGVATGILEKMDQVWRRFFKRTTKDSDEIKTYADNGTSVLTTQTYTSSGDDDDVGAAT